MNQKPSSLILSLKEIQRLAAFYSFHFIGLFILSYPITFFFSDADSRFHDEIVVRAILVLCVFSKIIDSKPNWINPKSTKLSCVFHSWKNKVGFMLKRLEEDKVTLDSIDGKIYEVLKVALNSLYDKPEYDQGESVDQHYLAMLLAVLNKYKYKDKALSLGEERIKNFYISRNIEALRCGVFSKNQNFIESMEGLTNKVAIDDLVRSNSDPGGDKLN